MLDRLSGATRLVPIIGDPIKYAESPGRLTKTFEEHGHDAVCVPMQVPQSALDDVIRGLDHCLHQSISRLRDGGVIGGQRRHDRTEVGADVRDRARDVAAGCGRPQLVAGIEHRGRTCSLGQCRGVALPVRSGRASGPCRVPPSPGGAPVASSACALKHFVGTGRPCPHNPPCLSQSFAPDRGPVRAHIRVETLPLSGCFGCTSGFSQMAGHHRAISRASRRRMMTLLAVYRRKTCG